MDTLITGLSRDGIVAVDATDDAVELAGEVLLKHTTGLAPVGDVTEDGTDGTDDVVRGPAPTNDKIKCNRQVNDM